MSLNKLTINGVRGPVYGATYAGRIWKQIMITAMKGEEIKGFGKADPKLLKSDKKKLPNVDGKDVGEAFGILREAGFEKVTVDSKPIQSSVPAGKVAKSDPPGGSSVGPDTEITLFLSAGGGPETGDPQNPNNPGNGGNNPVRPGQRNRNRNGNNGG